MGRLECPKETQLSFFLWWYHAPSLPVSRRRANGKAHGVIVDATFLMQRSILLQ